MGKTTRKKVPKPIVTQHQRQPDKPPADQKASRAAPKRQRAASAPEKTINVTAATLALRATLQQQIQAAVVEEDYMEAGRLKQQLLAHTSAPTDPSRIKKKRRKQISAAGLPSAPSRNDRSIKGFALGQALTTALHAEGYVTPTAVRSAVAFVLGPR